MNEILTVNHEGLEDILKSFDKDRDYYIATLPSAATKASIQKLLDRNQALLEASNLIGRTSSYLHMTQLYFPSMQRLARYFQENKMEIRLTESSLVSFFRTVLMESYPIQRFVVQEVGWLGADSVSLWLTGSQSRPNEVAYAALERLLLNSRMTAEQYEQLLSDQQFTLRLLRPTKWFPHLSIASRTVREPVPPDVLKKLTDVFKGQEIIIDRIELRAKDIQTGPVEPGR